MIKKQIEAIVQNFTAEYDRVHSSLEFPLWKTPLIGYADAFSPYVQNLPKLISDIHLLPQDVLSDAKTILCIFVPFTEEVGNSNRFTEELASALWAQAYEITNAMLRDLNETIIAFLQTHGYHAAITPEASMFDLDTLISNWSHRHFAYAAGMGTFGLNNMLITPQGTCGRFTTIVTDLDIKTGHPLSEELCLYRKNGTCGVCVRHCQADALTFEAFHRDRCYAVCQKNARVHNSYGSSYFEADGSANSVGSDVCGKCVTFAPCTYGVPGK